MTKLRKKIRKVIGDREARRKQVKQMVDSISTSPVSKAIVQDLINKSAGGQVVKYDPEINAAKGFEEGKKASFAVVLAMVIFGLVRSKIDMSPEVEYLVAGGISASITTLVAYLKQRIENRLKIKALEE